MKKSISLSGKKILFLVFFVLFFSTGLFAEREIYVEGKSLFFKLRLNIWDSTEFNSRLENLGYKIPFMETVVATIDYGMLFFHKDFYLGGDFALFSMPISTKYSLSNTIIEIYGNRVGSTPFGMFGSVKLEAGYALFHTPGFILTTTAHTILEWGYLALVANQSLESNFTSMLTADGTLSKIRHVDLSFGASVKMMLIGSHKYGENDQDWYEYSEYVDAGFFFEAGYSYVLFQGWKNVSYSGKADISGVPTLGEHRFYLGFGITGNIDLKLQRRGYER